MGEGAGRGGGGGGGGRGGQRVKEKEPLPQITCSLIAARRCSIDTVVRPKDSEALIINCNGIETQGVCSALQLRTAETRVTVFHSERPLSPESR